MATISTAIQLNDLVSGPMQHMTNAINMTLSSMQALDRGANVNFDAIQSEVAEANAGLRQMEGQLQTTERAAQRVSTGFKGWQKAIIVANQAVGLIKGTLASLGVTDMGGAFNRIDTMNRFQKTVSTITGDVDAANAALTALNNVTTGTAYGLDVASQATQGFLTRGMSLGAATEQVRIWADAVAFYGAGTNEQLQSVVDAIGKMYSKGTVEADQLDRLFDAGIGAAEIYAQAVGQSVSSVKDDLSAGNISAAQFLDTVSKAMDAGVSSGAAKDAGATWATTFANMQAAMSRGWVDVIEGLDAALASRGLPSSMEMVASFGAKIESMLTRIGGSTGAVVDVAVIVVDVLGAAFNAIGAVGGFIADNWSIIVPLILGVVAALIVYNATMGVAWLTTLKDLAVKGAHAIASAAETAAIIGLTIAQEGFNAALAMCPLTWIIIIIIAIIAIILAVIVAINKAQGKTVSAVGIIVGALAAAGAFIWNLVASLVNMAIGGFAALWNFLGGFANFFANFLRDPLGAAAHLIASFCTTALNLLSALAQAVDTLFGTDLVSSVNGWIDRVNGWADTVGNGKYQEEVQTINPADYYIDRKSYSGAYKWGYGKGSSAGGKIKDMFGGKDAASAAGSSIPSSLTNGVGNIDKNTDKIKDSVQSSSEDLKLLRELAERQAINKYTTASITVDMKGMTNQITSDRDIDGVINVMTKKLENALIVSAEGVHT